MAFSMGRCLNTPPINLSKIARAGGDHVAGAARNGEGEQAGADRATERQAFRGDGRPDEHARGRRSETTGAAGNCSDDRDGKSGHGNARRHARGGANMSAGAASRSSEEVAQDADVEVQTAKNEEIDLDRLATDSEDAPVIKIVNLILVQAIKEKASDIHIEPFQKTLKLRYRIDGELVAAESPPKALQLAITSRIKILAGLNIAERRVPQDGRFRIKVIGKEVDLRISILPTALRRENRHSYSR